MNDPPPDGDIADVWSGLRRRKVVQWGLVYVAAAWGLLQGVDFLTDAFEWPSHSKRIATLALLIGLPIVLVLAWYHGDRAQQRIITPELAMLTTLLLTYIWPRNDLGHPGSGHDGLFTRRLPIALPGFAPLDIRGLLRPTRGNAR